jgi:hypothetical protein
MARPRVDRSRRSISISGSRHDRADLTPFRLSNVGASIIVSSNEARFDVGDSQFEGGALTAHLEATRGDFDGGGKLQTVDPRRRLRRPGRAARN